MGLTTKSAEPGTLDRVRLPLTILLGALIIGGIVGVVGFNMRPAPNEDGRLQPITVSTPANPAPTPAVPMTSAVAPTSAPMVPTSAPVDESTDVPAPPPALRPVETTDDGGHHRGGDDHGGDDNRSR